MKFLIRKKLPPFFISIFSFILFEGKVVYGLEEVIDGEENKTFSKQEILMILSLILSILLLFLYFNNNNNDISSEVILELESLKQIIHELKYNLSVQDMKFGDCYLTLAFKIAGNTAKLNSILKILRQNNSTIGISEITDLLNNSSKE